MLFERALGRDERAGRPRHATALLPAVDAAVRDCGGWEAVDLIAAGVGPGSFTGLRIGIATARALSAALGVPAVGAGTLDALAEGLRERAAGRPVLALTDARRGELFARLHGAGEGPFGQPTLVGPEALLDAVGGLGEIPLAAGSGALRFRAELAGRGVEIPDDDDPAHRVAARHTCALGAAAADAGAGPPEPIYLRPPDAERWRERDNPSKSDR